MRKLVVLAVVLAASLAVLAPAASQEEQEAGINGFVTDVSGATVLIEEDPLEDSGSDKASVEITPETENLLPARTKPGPGRARGPRSRATGRGHVLRPRRRVLPRAGDGRLHSHPRRRRRWRYRRSRFRRTARHGRHHPRRVRRRRFLGHILLAARWIPGYSF